MADLLVHVASVAPGAKLLRDGRLRSLVYVGVCLPDVLYKLLLYGFGAPTWLCEPTHTPLGLLPFCYLAALFFEPEWRRRAFGALLAGAWAHLLVDVGKNFLGSGVIPWAFPFSMHTVELSWYAPEETVLLMPAALALIVAVEFLARRQRRSGAGGGGAAGAAPGLGRSTGT
jgi:hypothetical protein